MKKIYAHHDRFMVYQVKQLLEDKGIPCYIKNEYAIGGIGELSPFDALPEVWISDDEWLPRAEKLISEMTFQRHQDTLGWVCETCKEANDASFELCWQCGTEKTEKVG